MDFTNTLQVFILLLLVVVPFILRIWISSEINNLVQHKYNKALEDIKRQNLSHLEEEKNSREVRLKSALLAELLAEWVSYPSDRRKLRTLTYQAFIWLPEPIAKDLSSILAHEEGAKDITQILIDIRKHLLGESDTLSAESVVNFALTEKEITDIRINNPLS
ncbi:hypothetical protein [Providencia rettgeri]|uniref:hypothetical protein n=1 Tax=Providencia rettgeri TaxID=587 RepID=UPI001EE6F118|nr:hypothetical protein [Providencia rettgeri]MCG5279861.1 hypothetical protein [Providencia rettgeri]